MDTSFLSSEDVSCIQASRLLLVSSVWSLGDMLFRVNWESVDDRAFTVPSSLGEIFDFYYAFHLGRPHMRKDSAITDLFLVSTRQSDLSRITLQRRYNTEQKGLIIPSTA